MITGLKKYFILVFLLIYNVLLLGQTPTLIPLDYNPALIDRKPKMLKNNTPADTISIMDTPFFDDFTYYWRSSQPDKKWWIDDYVFINNYYPIEPRSNGVATFDALGADGKVYQNTSASFPADTLTSCPIDLGVSGLSNVFLSFFYQPQGYGDSPDPGDSLILQFKSSVSNQWRTVWKAEKRNNTIHEWVRSDWQTVWKTEVADLPPFKQVLHHVEGEYLYKGFQFRFVNYVSLEQDPFNPGRKSNADHWHIDYVRLDKNRNETDTASYDVAVIAPMKTLIRGYQSIPWNQLEYAAPTRLEPKVEITYRNNYNLAVRVDRHFTVTDVYRNIISPLSTGNEGSANIEANDIMTFSQDITFPFESTLVDSAKFEIKGYLDTNEFDRKENDTVRFYHFFKDYFARDDGYPESGYGFSGYNAQDCAVACRYETFMSDSLRAIMIYFNPTDNNASARYRFKIAVWRDNNGRPGELTYLSSTEYSPETTGQFTRYDLSEAVYITRYSPYWIGWVQVTTGFLNVGFDRNYNDKGNLWYNTGTWQQDINDGALMIRPVMGKRKDFATSTELPATVTDSRMKLYPNPASQHVRIELETTEAFLPSDYHVEIYDVTGRLRYREPYTDGDMDVSRFEPGLYIVRVIHRKSGNVQTQKLVIIK